MDTREKLNEFAELRGWNKNKPIGWSEAAYLAGFEPSSDDIPAHKEVQEAIEFLTIKHVET